MEEYPVSEMYLKKLKLTVPKMRGCFLQRDTREVWGNLPSPWKFQVYSAGKFFPEVPGSNDRRDNKKGNSFLVSNRH
jgi:hypothetical protein